MIPSYSFNLTTKPPDSMVILWASAIVQHSWSMGKQTGKEQKQKSQQNSVKFILPQAPTEGPWMLYRINPQRQSAGLQRTGMYVARGSKGELTMDQDAGLSAWRFFLIFTEGIQGRELAASGSQQHRVLLQRSKCITQGRQHKAQPSLTAWKSPGKFTWGWAEIHFYCRKHIKTN